MKHMQTTSKTVSLLKKISTQDVVTENKLLDDPGLQELFSWHTKRPARARLKDTLAILVRQGDISSAELGNKKIYQITEAGQQKLSRPPLSPLVHHTAHNWNQRWYFITYQIPDSHKSARNQLIIYLRKLGAQRYASALWITPYDMTSEVKKMATHYEVAQFIDFLRADTISQDRAWRKRFGLK